MKVEEGSSQRDEEYGGGRVQSSSPLYTPNMVRAYSDPPSDQRSEGRHNGISETPGVQSLNGRIVQESSARKEVARSTTEHYHEYREEVKGGGGRVDRNDDSAVERRRENEDWIGREKTKEKAGSAVVKSESVEIKTKATVTTEEKESKKGFVGLEEVDTGKIKAALERKRKSQGGSEGKPAGVEAGANKRRGVVREGAGEWRGHSSRGGEICEGEKGEEVFEGRVRGWRWEGASVGCEESKGERGGGGEE